MASQINMPHSSWPTVCQSPIQVQLRRFEVALTNALRINHAAVLSVAVDRKSRFTLQTRRNRCLRSAPCVWPHDDTRTITLTHMRKDIKEVQPRARTRPHGTVDGWSTWAAAPPPAGAGGYQATRWSNSKSGWSLPKTSQSDVGSGISS